MTVGLPCKVEKKLISDCLMLLYFQLKTCSSSSLSDDSDDEVSFRGSPKRNSTPPKVLSSALEELSTTLSKLKEKYESKLKQKVGTRI